MPAIESLVESATLLVDLEDRSYPIFVGQGTLETVDFCSYISGDKALVVTNETIAPLYLEAVLKRLKSKQVDSLVLPDGERYKSLDTLNLIFNKLLQQKHDRKTTLIALGGGVVGDMTGFAAATYQRGVPFIQIPTTLLAQVDSSVGGKTGVNHSLGKNMLGAFHQPSAVVVDTKTLQSLPEREFSAGMAEVIKYGLIADLPFLDWLEDNIDNLLARDSSSLRQAIERSCRNKAAIVSADETEQGIRAILNLGHTFGHAIETFEEYSGLLHGEAVAVGMAIAAHLSMLEGNIDIADVLRVKKLLQAFSLPVQPPTKMLEKDFLSLMMLDKKVLNGSIRLVLLKTVGQAYVTDSFDHINLNSALADACAYSELN